MCVCVCMYETGWPHSFILAMVVFIFINTEVLVPRLQSVFQNDHRIASWFFAVQLLRELSGAEHQPAGTVSWS